PSCGDQNHDVGEFCFKFVQLLAVTEVQSLATADFNADGIIDLAVGRKDDVLVLFGDGTGGFPLQADLPEPGSNYFGAAAGDLDGDQLADLVVSQAGGDAVLVYRSLGGGSFADPVSFATGDEPRRLVLVDLDNDSILDLAVSILNHDTVEVLLGDGGGGFGPRTAFASDGDHPIELSFGLFNHGSAPDLVVANFDGKSLALLLGAGSGQLNPAQLYPLAGKPRSAVVADFDRDESLDVAVALEDRDRVQILYGDGLGGLIDLVVELPVGDRPMGALAGDFNLDSVPDLLVLNRDDASVGLLFGAPDQPEQFMRQVLLVGFDGLAGMAAITSADLNNDGVVDVIVGGAGIRAMISDP
ncbi:MAG TPA: VCBS repeat-containing protein, partial [Enhygromyxa sp.]|nr:VCBS repeat-containing protein [Enhygromyxa sp.]